MAKDARSKKETEKVRDAALLRALMSPPDPKVSASKKRRKTKKKAAK